MNVLFMNRNCGAGVEFEGNLFVEILERTKGIDNLDVYRIQCRNTLEHFDFKPYDLIIVNDGTLDAQYDRKFEGCKVVNISFGGSGRNSPAVDMVFDLNLPYTMKCEKHILNYLPLNFISGNIWRSKVPWESRSDGILYISRLCPSKIVPEFLLHCRKYGKKVEFYGPIMDQDYYEEWKDTIDYKGFVSHKELLDVYNSYKAVYLWSETECLSMTIREAILCGTVPVIYDNDGYSTFVKDYVIASNDRNNMLFATESLRKDIADKMSRDYRNLSNMLSFDKLVLDFIYGLRGLTLKDLRFDKYHRNKVNELHKVGENVYTLDSINWEVVLI